MMINRRRLPHIVLAVAAVATVTLASGTASAQSNYYPPTPAQGPPPNLSEGSANLTIDTFITRHCCDPTTGAADGVYDQIEQAIAANNAAYGTGSTGAVVTATKTRYAPWMYSTQSTDSPNQRVVLTSYFITYDISNIYWHGVSYPFSRTAGQSIDIQVSCEGWYPWYQGQGQLTLTSIVSPVALDAGHSVLEDTFGGILWNNAIPDYVDSQISAKLSRFPSGTHKTPLGFSCNTLGTQAFSDNPKLDEVLWDFVRPKFPGNGNTVLNQLSVLVTKVRRLTVHNLSNAPIYYAVENPRLELYVGYKHLAVELPQMLEGQEFFPGSSAIVSVPMPPVTAQYAGQNVIIANMWQVPQDIEDSTFLVFDKATNFGVGTRLVDTPKIWSYLNPLVSRKPIIVRSNGYEVTLQISGPPILTE
jgi:hypothetical protein